VLAGCGAPADSWEERQYMEKMRAWAAKKSAATGKKWEVGATGESPTSEGVSEAHGPWGKKSAADIEKIRKAQAREKKQDKPGQLKKSNSDTKKYSSGAAGNYFSKFDETVEESDVQEWKKDRKAPIKPRNFVAKNATTSGAGAHKDKKKDAKQGKAKHKKKPELAESATYERRLNVLLEAKLLTEQIKQFRK
jgi:hypothetical protein